MRVVHFPCGPAANESELLAIEHLKSRLVSAPGSDEWVLLSNLAFSANSLQADEIDIVVIGPPGVRVLEVKHWTARWINDNDPVLDQEIDKLTAKARRIGTTLRATLPDLPFVGGAILLTRQLSGAGRSGEGPRRGVPIMSLEQWRAAVDIDSPRRVTDQHVRTLARLLEPRSPLAIDGSLRRLAGYTNLEPLSEREDRFHRVYKGIHGVRRDRVVLHLYDLSASEAKGAEAKARRESVALRLLQRHAWAPGILDSFQPVPGYPGEMFFFTVVDPLAPTVEDRATDSTWESSARVIFARNAARALGEMHVALHEGLPMVHRNITPRTLLVRHDNSPILTGFDRPKIPSDVSVASLGPPGGKWEVTTAPEVRSQGLGAADVRSDVFSLCKSLMAAFKERQEDQLCQGAIDVLRKGLVELPQDRWTADQLADGLAALLGEPVPVQPPPPARYWTEDQVVGFRDHDYRIVGRLGSGGVGTTFKVVGVDRATGEDVGTYVAKVAHSSETGQGVLRAYNLARSHLGRHPGLSAIYEVAKQWKENDFSALLTWVDGAPLSDWLGLLPLLAEELREASADRLVVRWAASTCEALDVLHRNGLVHGDVSPRNLILSGGEVVLTDYDFVAKIGERVAAPGTLLYSSPSYVEGRDSAPSDDIYATAASYFHVLFEREPFQYAGSPDKSRGLNWEGVERGTAPMLAEFLDRATHPDPTRRFCSAAEALAVLRPVGSATPAHLAKPTEGSDLPTWPSRQSQLVEGHVEWLLSLLKSYPGSPFGNPETRGLDSDFAAQTYVPTALEQTLLEGIRGRRARLVVLCGNAGDGKTAMLQHLASRLGLGSHRSSERVVEGRMNDGMVVRINLDGSASWQGRSSDQILDEFLAPFRFGAPVEDIVHLLAINDGRLLEWIDTGEQTHLREALSELLEERVERFPYIRFISLNHRSLVGGVNGDRTAVDSGFVHQLIDQLFGGDRAAEIWAPCATCSAQTRCEVRRAQRLFGPAALTTNDDGATCARAHDRLVGALQAVHLRGEVHITARELRAALVYILFGVHSCADYHGSPDPHPLPFWDRAFDAASPFRQGELLRELTHLDPALESHPQVDRHLLRGLEIDECRTAPAYGPPLHSARRRAYFEWTTEHLVQVARDTLDSGVEALGLARGRYLEEFRSVALGIDAAAERRRRDICERLCRGIARLEDLPPQALDRPDVVPLRIRPRTPTETAFWVEKPIGSFSLECDLPPEWVGVERLHRHVFLVYRYRDGREERLRLGADLFHLLLELSDGYQLGDLSTDDTFAHLSIFVQRLVREDDRELLAWSPTEEEAIFRVSAQVDDREGIALQRVVLTRVLARGER